MVDAERTLGQRVKRVGRGLCRVAEIFGEGSESVQRTSGEVGSSGQAGHDAVTSAKGLLLLIPLMLGLNGKVSHGDCAAM